MSSLDIETNQNVNGTVYRGDMGDFGAMLWGPAPSWLPSLWSTGKRKRVMPKDVIYREGEQGDMVYLVRAGLVKLLTYLPNGRARIVRLHTRDHWIGLDGMLGKTYEHTAIAIDDVEVRQIPIQGLERMREEVPSVHSHLLRQWHSDLAQADKWISDFSTGGIKSRVARLLQYLAELEYGPDADRVKLLTVHEMAEILGVTQESVSRILASFKRGNILRKQANPAREIYQLDTQKLLNEARK